MKPTGNVLLLLFFLLVLNDAFAQKLTREQVNDTIYSMPAFSMYEDNYFISGIPLHTGISNKTADAKYQISFKQLLTRNTLPLESYLFLTYTQKAFWNVYQFSSPFREINFNPGLGLGKPVFNSHDRLVGMAFLKIEHESNGRDSTYSRSWNNVSLDFKVALNAKTTLSLKGWFPFRYKKDNPDLLEYIGPGELNLSYEMQPDKMELQLMLRKGLNWEWKGAARARFLYRPFAMRTHYFMLEWFTGYAESLISYRDFKSMIRIGYIIKSDNLNFLRPLRAQ